MVLVTGRPPKSLRCFVCRREQLDAVINVNAWKRPQSWGQGIRHHRDSDRASGRCVCLAHRVADVMSAAVEGPVLIRDDAIAPAAGMPMTAGA